MCDQSSAQSDHSLRCPHEETIGTELPIERTVKTLIRLGRCPGSSESSLDEHIFLLVVSFTANVCQVVHILCVCTVPWIFGLFFMQLTKRFIINCLLK